MPADGEPMLLFRWQSAGWSMPTDAFPQTVEELPVREGRNKVTLYKFGRGIPAANGRPMEVWLYEVKGGNHSWSDADMDTYEETWKFFSKWM